MELVDTQEFDDLRQYVRDRYEQSGQSPEVVHALNQHNDRVLGHAELIARGEGLDEGEVALLKMITILHDVSKADAPLLLHAEVGSEVAAEKLRELGKDDAFVELVQSAIRCHMGPFPFIDEEAEKYEERTGDHLDLPRPQTHIEKLFYDADMLALIDIHGIEKIRVLRESTPQFIEEDEKVAANDKITRRAAAYRSAMQSVQRAADTLFSKTARAEAARLVAEAESYIAQKLSAEDTDAP